MSNKEGNIKKKASVFLLTLMLLASTFTVVMGVNISTDTNKSEDENELRDLMDSPWPMFGGGSKHTGQSPYNTSHVDGTEKWRFNAGRDIYSSPAIDRNGTIYVGSDDNKLIAVYANGTEKWNFSTGYRVRSSPAISGDGTIYVGSDDNNLYAIYPNNGTEKWSFSFGTYDCGSSPAIGSDGTIYVGSDDDKLYAIYPNNGTEKWSFTSGGDIPKSPGIADDGTIYVGSQDDNLYAIYPDNGTEKWRFATGGSVQSSPAIADDGTIYIGSYDENLYAVYPDNGTKKWSFAMEGFNGYISSSPAVSSEGTIYMGSADNYLYAINPNGTKKWKYNTGGDVFSSPAIGSEGTIYVGSDSGKLCAINPNGTRRWNFWTAKDEVSSSPAIGSDGTIYVGDHPRPGYSGPSNLYAISGPPDLTPPSVNITSPGNNTNISTDSITVQWDGNDSDSGIDHYEISLDGGTWIDVGYNTSHDLHGLTEGNHEVFVEAIDNASNTKSDSVNFTVDTVEPISSLEDISPYRHTSSPLAVNATASDSTSGVNNVSLYYRFSSDNSSWNSWTWFETDNSLPWNWSFAFPNGDGYYEFYSIAVDNVTNIESGKSSAETICIYDATSPALSIDSPSNNAYISNTSVTAKWTGADSGSGIDHYEISLDGGTWIDVGYNTSHQFTGLAETSHTIDVRVLDNCSNSEIDSVNFGVDVTVPELTITYPSNNSELSNGSFTMHWTGSDSGSGIDRYEIQMDDGGWTDVETNTSYTFSSLSIGSYEFDVNSIDKAGNNLIETVNFSIVSGPAQITDLTEWYPTTGDDFSLKVNVTSVAGVSSVYLEYRFGSGNHFNESMVESRDDWGYEITGIPDDGQELYYIYHVKDDSGRWTSTDDYIVDIIDNDPPQITDNSQKTGTNGDIFHFEFDISDNIFVSSVYLEYWSGDDTPQNVSLNGLESGIYGHNITIPSNMTDTIHYVICAGDTSSNWASISTNNITVLDDDDPKAKAGMDVTVNEGGTVDFNGGLSYDNIAITDYIWTFTEGTEEVTLDGESPSYTFNYSGNYTVSLTVIDGAGNEDIDTVTVNVKASPVDTGEDDNSDETEDEGFEFPWWILVVIATIIILVFFVLFFKNIKGRSSEEEMIDEEDNVGAKVSEEKEV